ncbi:MAG: FKBP-type peptidyl-prolyl cis-trans isomerase [Pirellulaceae bacterium]|nr:FKBP-type peptidyl-prolyl cis-trans isomerase [Pirellulaceae bacterium]
MRSIIVCALVALVAVRVGGQEKLEILDTKPAKPVGDVVSYGLGFNYGANLASQGVKAEDIVEADFVRGLLRGLNLVEPEATNEQLQAAMQQFVGKLEKRRSEMIAAKLVESMKFIEENKKQEGVQVTASGLQYKIIKSGSGATPTAESTVTVHYEGKLTDGRIFDSSIKRGEPFTTPVGKVIPGWTEALQRMKVGDKWMLYIPPNLGYGEQGSQGAIGPNEVLIFEVELLEVN